MNEDKVKKDIEEIETINIKLDHRVSKLIAENEHLKQTYKQLYDSIKPTRIRSKEQCDALINQVNQKSVEISDLNVSLQEKDLAITALKDEIRKLIGKDLADNIVTKHTIAPEMLKFDMEPITPTLLNNRTAHSDYLRHTQEQAAILKENSKLNANSKLLCVKCNGCMLSDNHDLCVLDFINDVNARVKSKSVKKSLETSRKGNACPLTRITTTAEVPLRKPTALESDTPKPVVTLVHSRKPRKSKTNVPVSKSKVFKSLYANKKEPIQSWGSIVFDVPSSSLDECWSSKFIDPLTPEVINPNAEVVAPAPAKSISSPSSTTVDQDAPSPKNVFESSFSDVIPTVVHTAAPNSEHVIKWTKDHPLDNIIGELETPVSTRLQLHEEALFCYYDAFLTSVEPKTYKDVLTQSCWIEAMQEELNEFERLKVWELV
ncbi:hypothetical protein Tco_1198649, partial [Tanacetum coccineum]